MYKQTQEVNIVELHFGIIRVPILKSVWLNEHLKLEKIQHCIVRVAIEASVQLYGHEQNTRSEREFRVPTVCVSIYSDGQIK